MPTANLCMNGHLSLFEEIDGVPFPALSERPPKWQRCGKCATRFVWEARDEKEINALKVCEAPIKHICNLGHEHEVSPAIYEIPEEGRLAPSHPPITCGLGWLPLIEPLVEQCERLGVEVQQIKEKMGSLRFYVKGQFEVSGTKGKEIDDLFLEIIRAEARSRTICELCGKPGSLTDPSRRWWVKTFCEMHTKWWYDTAEPVIAPPPPEAQ